MKTFASKILNIIGMAVAFAAFYIIVLQVHYDLSFNKGIDESEKIYVLSAASFNGDDKRQLSFCRPLAELALTASPNIEYGGVINLCQLGRQLVYVEKQEERIPCEMNLTTFSGTALQAVGMKAVAGSLEEVTGNNTLAISESTAEKFGLQIGSQVAIPYNGVHRPYTVMAIWEDFPENTHLSKIEALTNLMEASLTDATEWGYTYLFKVHDTHQNEQMQELLTQVILSYYEEQLTAMGAQAEAAGITKEELALRVNKLMEMATPEFIPLNSLYFHDNIQTPIQQGNRTTTLVLLIVALLVVSIAFINYINFFFSLIPVKIRSINIRKVLGSSRGQLILSLTKESLQLILCALLLAAMLVVLFKKTQLVHFIDADIAFQSHPYLTLATVLIALSSAVLVSLYPAFHITSFQPSMVLKGSFGSSRAGRHLRNVLIGVQFVISFCLIICTLFIKMQRQYMMDFDMGFDKEQLLYVFTSQEIGAMADQVEERLKANPQISDVTWSAGELIAEIRMGWGRSYKDRSISFQCYPVADDFLEFMDIQITEGRSFRPEDRHSENGAFIFNEAARREYALVLNDQLGGHRSDAPIVGFCEDFSFQSLKESVHPFALYHYGQHPWYTLTTAFIRVTPHADYPSLMRYIAEVLSEFQPEISPDQWEVLFFEENLNDTYRKEQELSQLINLFSMIAIIISLMGVLGLVLFETEHRRREIALRRVHGATVQDILKMFSVQFARIILVCFVLAAPLAGFIARQYIRGFAHQCPLYPWVFLISLLSVMALTVGVVILRSYRAATSDPAAALKTE